MEFQCDDPIADGDLGEMQVEFKNYIAVFLDVLGMREAMSHFELVPPPGDPDLEDFRAAMRKSIGAIVEFQDFFQRTLRFLRDKQEEGIKKTELHAYGASEVKVECFSDGLLAYLPLCESSATKVPPLALENLLITTAASCLCMLSIGRPLRGGAALGVGAAITIRNSCHFYGPASIKSI